MCCQFLLFSHSNVTLQMHITAAVRLYFGRYSMCSVLFHNTLYRHSSMLWSSARSSTAAESWPMYPVIFCHCPSPTYVLREAFWTYHPLFRSPYQLWSASINTISIHPTWQQSTFHLGWQHISSRWVVSMEQSAAHFCSAAPSLTDFLSFLVVDYSHSFVFL